MKGKRPADIKYTETHEWAKLNGKIVTVGITDFAVEQLGDITHIELPKIGASTEEGSAFGEVDSVKTTADLVSPVSGKVVEVNTALEKNLDALGEDPFEEGWLVKIKIKDAAQLESLMSACDYEELLESEKGEETEAGDDDEDVSMDDFA